VAIGWLPYQLDRLVSFPVSNYPTTNPFLPSRETQKKNQLERSHSVADGLFSCRDNNIGEMLFVFFVCFFKFSIRINSQDDWRAQ
jgi:hypothetical protein